MLTPLEQSVVNTLLDEHSAHFDGIRAQLAVANISRREFTGVGFFTEFSLPCDSAIERGLPDLIIGGVGAEIEGLRYGAGFLLFVRNGQISTLEGFTYDEPWPESIKKFVVYRYKTTQTVVP